MISITLTIQRDVKNDKELDKYIKKLEREGWTVDIMNDEEVNDDNI